MSLKRKAADLAAADAKKPKANGSITSFFGQPKPVAGGSTATKPTVSVSFNKEEWVAKLTDEQKQLLKLEIDTLHESWLAYLKDEIVTKEFLELKRFLKRETDGGKKVFPPMEDVYSWYAFLLASSGFTSHSNLSHERVHMERLYTPTDATQVSPHPPAHRQSRNPRPRPVPQLQPGARPRLLRASPNASPAVSPEHVQSTQKGLPNLPTAAQEWRPTNALGGPWRVAAEHMSDGARARGQQPRGQGLGALHAEGD